MKNPRKIIRKFVLSGLTVVGLLVTANAGEWNIEKSNICYKHALAADILKQKMDLSKIYTRKSTEDHLQHLGEAIKCAIEEGHKGNYEPNDGHDFMIDGYTLAVEYVFAIDGYMQAHPEIEDFDIAVAIIPAFKEWDLVTLAKDEAKLKALSGFEETETSEVTNTPKKVEKVSKDETLRINYDDLQDLQKTCDKFTNTISPLVKKIGQLSENEYHILDDNLFTQRAHCFVLKDDTDSTKKEITKIIRFSKTAQEINGLSKYEAKDLLKDPRSSEEIVAESLQYFKDLGIDIKKERKKIFKDTPANEMPEAKLAQFQKENPGVIEKILGVNISSKVKDKTLKNKETMELLRTFAIDESVNYTMYDWTTGTDKVSLIDWKYTGIRVALAYDGKPRSDYPYKREGIATIENNNKWNITLLGARSGYLIVELDTGIISESPPKLVLDKKYILEEKNCKEAVSYNTSIYLIKFENKKPFWLQEMFSAGSGGSSYFYTILYNNKPKCETETELSKIKNKHMEKYGQNMLHKAVLSRKIEDVKKLIENNVLDLNQADKLGRIPLHYAAFNGDIEIAKVLLENGANINAGDKTKSWTPLFFAVFMKHKEMTNFLIEYGADKTHKDKLNRTIESYQK